jgi:hypothetical protein
MDNKLLQVLDMKDNTHEELELDAWTPLRTANARLLNNLFDTPFGRAAATASSSGTNEQKNEDRDVIRRGRDNDEQKAKDHRAYLEQRMKDYAAFERRARGERS